jgi:hypothetical protein
MGPANLAGAEVFAEEARVRASRHSTSIPPTIRVRPLTTDKALVEAGGPDVPLAGLYEYGNKGRRNMYFIHPVFSKPGEAEYEDRSNWPQQPRWPFMAPSIRPTLRKIEKGGAALIDKINRRTGVTNA